MFRMAKMTSRNFFCVELVPDDNYRVYEANIRFRKEGS